MTISGTVYDAKDRPAPDVRMYLYHTDANGLYVRTGSPTRLSRLRTWLITDAQGRYRFRTIKPASYPQSTIPSHIHVHLATNGLAEFWIPNFLFDGDPFLTAEEKAGSDAAGRFAHVVRLERNNTGVLTARRDIRFDPGLGERNRLTPSMLRALGR